MSRSARVMTLAGVLALACGAASVVGCGPGDAPSAPAPAAGVAADEASTTRDLPMIAHPKEVLDPPWLAQREQDQLRTVGRFEVFYDFRFVDRAAAERHHVRPPRHRRLGQGVQAGALRPRQRDRRRRRRWRRTPGPLLRQPAGRQRALEQPGRRRVRRHHAERRASGSPAGSACRASFADIDNDGDAGPLRDNRPQAATACSTTTAAADSPTSTEQSGLGYVGHSSGAVFFDYDRDGLLDLFVCNVGRYTTDEIGPRRVLRRARRTRSTGHLNPERTETQHPVPEHGRQPFRRRHAGAPASSTMSWSGDASPSTSTATAGPTSTC